MGHFLFFAALSHSPDSSECCCLGTSAARRVTAGTALSLAPGPLPQVECYPSRDTEGSRLWPTANRGDRACLPLSWKPAVSTSGPAPLSCLYSRPGIRNYPKLGGFRNNSSGPFHSLGCIPHSLSTPADIPWLMDVVDAPNTPWLFVL